MNIVVTGATSFIGAPMVDKLMGMGHDVYAVVRPASKNIARLDTGRERLHVIEMNLEEADRLDGAILVPCEAFFHFGWDGAGSENRMNRDVQQKNASDSLKALEGARKLGCRTFLFSGSQAEYGITDGLMREDSPCHPVSEYGKDKLEVCRRAGEKAGELGITYLHTRIFSVYGPGDHPWSLVSSCVDTFLKGGHMEFGACTQLWNYLYIKDAVRAITGLLLAKSPSGVYNVAGNDTRPLREFIGEIHRLCGGRGTFEYGKRPPNAEGVVSLNPDTGKLYRAANFQPRISFEEGIREMIANHEFYKENS